MQSMGLDMIHSNGRGPVDRPVDRQDGELVTQRAVPVDLRLTQPCTVGLHGVACHPALRSS